MALAASPPPAILSPEQEEQSLQLDDDIAKVRAEIAALTQRRNRLTSALLSSTQVQSHLRQETSVNEDTQLNTLLDQHVQHNQQSTYRLGFGVTGFPFTDPSPDTSNVPLVGIRFDVAKTNGQFDTPYYILCKRVSDETSELKVHKHTIPALVPLNQYEEKCLPLSDEGYGSEDSVLGARPRQDLEEFVRLVRSDLVAWRLRQESIEIVRAKLGIRLEKPVSEYDQDDQINAAGGQYGVLSVEPVAVDVRFVRIIWTDGRVGRVKIGDDGRLQKAAVIGSVDGQDQRCPNDERILLGDNARIETLSEQLQAVYESRAAPE